jgi:aryl-alcohol dehydrogenase-like predicted oxidoreductase
MNGSGTERLLGRSGISVPALGVGTNRWNASRLDQAPLRDTFAAALDAEMGLFDTAELYSSGRAASFPQRSESKWSKNASQSQDHLDTRLPEQSFGI